MILIRLDVDRVLRISKRIKIIIFHYVYCEILKNKKNYTSFQVPQ